MSRFNNTKNKNKTLNKNKAGGTAFEMNDKFKVTNIVLTSFLTGNYYESENDVKNRLIELIKNDKKYAAKLAVFARNEFGMRTITHVVAAELAYYAKGTDWIRPFLQKIIYRIDDMTEILAYHQNKYNTIPNNIKYAFRNVLSSNQFNEYQLAKYQMKNKDWSLVDIVNVTHPNPTDKNEEAFTKLMNGNLKQHETWENQLSKVGKLADTEKEKQQMKKTIWTDLVMSEEISYFALLRNLRNIIDYTEESTIDKAFNILTDKDRIKGNVILPFRYYTAYKNIANEITKKMNKKLSNNISEAIKIAFENIPKFEGNTFIAIDSSGSMTWKSLKSMYPIEIAVLFGMALWKVNDADVMLFDHNIQNLNGYLEDKKDRNIINVVNNVIRNKVKGGGTDFNLVFENANKKYDRIIILSDMQGWIEGERSVWGRESKTPMKSYKEYKEEYNTEPYIYSWDLESGETTQFPEDKIIEMSGYSGRIFDIMKLMEKNKKALFDRINRVDIKEE